jgi:hypothetical protein
MVFLCDLGVLARNDFVLRAIKQVSREGAKIAKKTIPVKP